MPHIYPSFNKICRYFLYIYNNNNKTLIKFFYVMEENKTFSQNITMDAMDREFNDALKASASFFNEKNYLNTKLAKGETKKEIQFRLLPIDANSNTPFLHIKTHQVKVPKEVAASGYKNYFCLSASNPIDHAKFGTECPFCKLNHEAYEASQKETDPVKKEMYKQISFANKKIDTCIVRGIERGAEADGPKFYKFNEHKDGSDVFNKIKTLYQARRQESIDEGDEPENILDIYTGKDLKLTITTDGKKTSVDVIDCGKNKPLSKDPEEIQAWINDPKKWTDVFAVKPIEYLKIIMNGKTPYFNKQEGKWVEKVDYSAQQREKKEKEDNMDAQITQAENSYISASTINVAEEYSQELPF